VEALLQNHVGGRSRTVLVAGSVKIFCPRERYRRATERNSVTNSQVVPIKFFGPNLPRLYLSFLSVVASGRGIQKTWFHAPVFIRGTTLIVRREHFNRGVR
jgi:hypothetical protein